jgi:hypothetical protein
LVTDVDPADAPELMVDWYVNGLLVTTAETLSGYVRGDVVQARVQAWDGEDPSLQMSSAGVTVANAPPRVVRAAMIPPQPTAADDVSADLAFVDADGDPVTGVVAWFADGAQVYVGPTLPAGTADAGDRLRYDVTPDDGLDTGLTTSSPEVLVGS